VWFASSGFSSSGVDQRNRVQTQFFYPGNSNPFATGLQGIELNLLVFNKSHSDTIHSQAVSACQQQQ
jgi:hypothetical protein